MDNEPDYYAILGLQPTATAAQIEVAYHGRSLRFRVGQLRQRQDELQGPTQEEVERAFAVLGNPEARAAYDAVHFPGKAPDRATPARRFPLWVWLVAAAWVVALCVVVGIGLRGRFRPEGGAIGQIVATAGATRAAGGVLPTAAASAAPSIALIPSPTGTAVTLAAVTATFPPPPGTPVSTPVAPAVTDTPVPPPATATRSLPSPTATLPPTATPPPTATAVPPTATAAPPTATPIPPTPTPEPPPAPEPPPPAPPPAFPATDRIGTAVPVNLRSGPGTNFPAIRLLAPGTRLAATGQMAFAGGFLWRRFAVEGGGIGWVRDVDVLPAP